MQNSKLKTAVALLLALAMGVSTSLAADEAKPMPKPDAQTADMSKPVQVFLIMGQSNAVGMGNVAGVKDGTLEHAVKTEKLYPYLLDAAGNWAERNDVRNVKVMVGRGGGMNVLHNEAMKVGKSKIGVEFGLAIRSATSSASP
jgi:hypothetical protein